MDARAFALERPASTGQSPDADGEPRSFGRYTLHSRLARGGMASVYLAEHRTAEGFRKWLAIKTIHPHFADDAEFVAMFHDEARLAARFDHPNICTVFDFGQIDDTYYLAMEYLHGEPLASVVRRGNRGDGVPIAVALSVIADAARGLHAAHELKSVDGAPARVVHRDVSPQNIFVLFSGPTKVVDFGVAKFSDKVQRTIVGEVKGKPGYLAPEQCAGGPLDRRADIFSLGIVLWECLTGERLFRGESDAATSLLVLTKPIPPPSSVRRECPNDLDRVVLRALERDPSHRFQTADEFALALEACARAWPSAVSPRETSEWMQRVFADEIRAKDDALKRASEAEDARASVAGAPESPPPRRTSPPLPPALAAPDLEASRRRPWRRPVVVAIAGVLTLGLAALGVASRARSSRPPPVLAPPTDLAHAVPSTPPPEISPPVGTDSTAAAEPPPATAIVRDAPAPSAPRPAHRAAPDSTHRPPLRPLRGYPGAN